MLACCFYFIFLDDVNVDCVLLSWFVLVMLSVRLMSDCGSIPWRVVTMILWRRIWCFWEGGSCLCYRRFSGLSSWLFSAVLGQGSGHCRRSRCVGGIECKWRAYFLCSSSSRIVVDGSAVSAQSAAMGVVRNSAVIFRID